MKCWRLPRNLLGFSIVFVDKNSKDVERCWRSYCYLDISYTSYKCCYNWFTYWQCQAISFFVFWIDAGSKRRKKIVKEKKQLDTENQNLDMKESNLQQLLVILPSQAATSSKAPTLTRQHNFWVCLCHFYENKRENILSWWFINQGE